MSLEQFCLLAGCVVSENPQPEGWGGRYMYTLKDSPGSFYCGYRTPKSAMKAFLRDTFGELPSKAIERLIAKEQSK